MTACYKNAGRWLAVRRSPSYADSGPCPALLGTAGCVCIPHALRTRFFGEYSNLKYYRILHAKHTVGWTKYRGNLQAVWRKVWEEREQVRHGASEVGNAGRRTDSWGKNRAIFSEELFSGEEFREKHYLSTTLFPLIGLEWIHKSPN